jgi:hypothetical protein
MKGTPAATRRVSREERRKPPDVVRPSPSAASIIFSTPDIIIGAGEGAPLGTSDGAPLGTPEGDADGTGIRALNLPRVPASWIL